MKNKKIVVFTLGAALAGLALSSPVQAGRIDARQEHQRARIGSGVCSGALTRTEATRLTRRQRDLARDERLMRLDGLSLAERRVIERRQDRLSREISRQKHDAQRRPF